MFGTQALCSLALVHALATRADPLPLDAEVMSRAAHVALGSKRPLPLLHGARLAALLHKELLEVCGRLGYWER